MKLRFVSGSTQVPGWCVPSSAAWLEAVRVAATRLAARARLRWIAAAAVAGLAAFLQRHQL